jgi:hypothetical protein
MTAQENRIQNRQVTRCARNLTYGFFVILNVASSARGCKKMLRPCPKPKSTCHSEERSDEESPPKKDNPGMRGTLPAVVAFATMAESARYAQRDKITEPILGSWYKSVRQFATLST